MKRYAHLIAPILCGALLTAAPSTLADPILKVIEHPVVTSAPLNLEQIRQRMIVTATRRGWSINDDGPQKFRASIGTSTERRQVVVSITYTDKAYSITLLESKGFGQSG